MAVVLMEASSEVLLLIEEALADQAGEHEAVGIEIAISS
jgi:hypothetical protein